MELKEFLALIRKYRITFFMIILVVFFLGLVIYNQQRKIYLGSIAVNISREDKMIINGYQYDQFYRLEADEKFGKNVVNWIGDPGLMELNRKDFMKVHKGNWSDISKTKAVQLSANYIKVSFKSKTLSSATVFGKVIKNNLNRKTQQLKSDQRDKNWFKLVIDDVQVGKNNVNIYLISLISICLGVLSGIFGVLLRYYFEKTLKK